MEAVACHRVQNDRWLKIIQGHVGTMLGGALNTVTFYKKLVNGEVGCCCKVFANIVLKKPESIHGAQRTMRPENHNRSVLVIEQRIRHKEISFR